MEQSILKSTKQVLHIAEDDDSFDLNVITHINAAFSTLNDLGVGPDDGFAIESDEEEWADFLPDDKVQLGQVKTLILLSVRLAFDPPQTAFLLEASQRQLAEATSRISIRRENKMWAAPVEDLADVIDGGDAEG